MNNYPREAKNIYKILSAPFPFFALMAGVQLGVFAALKDKPMKVEQIADAIGANPIKLKSLLYALVAAKLLAVEKGELFSNTCEASQFLIPESSSYMCDHVHYNVHPLIMSWTMSGGIKLAESIRTGKPQIEYDFSALSEDELAMGFRTTHPIALRAGRELAAKYNFSSCHTLADVGGGVGGLSIAITEIYPHIKATVIELPKITPITQRFVDEAQAEDRVQVISANLIHDSLEVSFDVAVLRAFIQILSQDDAIKVLRSTYKILKPGGIIYILGHILDDLRTTPIEEVWYSIININFYDIPGSYTEREYSNWLMEAGFVQIERGFLPNGDGVMIARKPK